MSDKKLDRRAFLKLALAAAAGAGLSHFRILNVGGPGVAYAGPCGIPPQNPDYCNPTPGADPDECNPLTDPDECKPSLGDVDLCLPIDGEVDYACNPPTAADTCNPPGDPDLCEPLAGETDTCLPPDDLDSCTPGDPNDPDECNPPTGNLDYACDPTGGDNCAPPAAPDWCDPWAGWVDECTASGDTDYQCSDPGADTCGVGDPDLCEPAYEPDDCLPPPDDMDLPTAVDVASFKGRSGTDSGALTLPALGLAAALGGAAIALRRRGQSPGPEDDPE